MALARETTHTTSADGTFSATGATEWNRAHTMSITGAVSGGIPFFDSTTTEATSGVLTAGRVVLGGGAGAAPNDTANLSYSATGSLGSGPLLTIGSGTTTSVGWHSGYGGASGYSAVWPGAVTPGGTNYMLLGSANEVYLNAPATSINFRIGNTQRGSMTATEWVPGSSGVQSLGLTGNRFTTLFLSGACTAASYTVGAAAGASFGPGLPTSITVVNGIVTAIA